MIGRREFLRNGLVGAGCVFAAKASLPFAWAQSKSIDSRIEVLTGEPLGIISPNLYGHFTENLSGVIYDGIHEPLVSEAEWFAVQAILASRRIAGERSWRHTHYLKGSVFCGRQGRGAPRERQGGPRDWGSRLPPHTDHRAPF